MGGKPFGPAPGQVLVDTPENIAARQRGDKEIRIKKANVAAKKRASSSQGDVPPIAGVKRRRGAVLTGKTDTLG